jgi:site-specific recombinase XerD
MHRLQRFPSLKRLAFLGPQSQGLVAAYLTHLQARQYAATTVQSTLDALKSFCVLLPAPRQPCLYQDLTATTATDVEAWLLAAHRKGLAPSTINHLLSVMHRFFGFLHERGLGTQQPIHWRRHHVIVPQSLPKPMREDDLVQLFRVIDRLRDRTMFLLMVRCGLRVGEVSALMWPSINFKAGSIRIDNSKGQVDRVVYFSRDADNALHQWRHTQPFEATYVFPSPLQPGTPLSVRAIQHLMAKYLHAAGITKSYSPHALRHTFATHLLNAGAPLEVVKELMGHRSISMTLRYTQLYDATTRDQYYRAMERLEKRQAFLEG